MKKSLSVVLSSAMAFSMFASVAFGKTSADFNDLKDLDAATKAKFDALISAGIFDGVAEGQFGLTQNMTRAQAAKVLALIYGVKVDETVKTSSFSDVKGDDAANGWAIPYIEAAKKAGLIDGMTDTTFAPGQNVTLGQFATLLVKGLGKKVDTTGTPWYADAIKQATDLKLLPAGTDGSKLATRSDLVLGAFEGKSQYVAPVTGKVSVTGVKAIGAKKLEVTFSEPVDTAKATLAVTRGAATVGVVGTPVWNATKTSAVLNLELKLDTAEYTVTLGGLDAAAINVKSASVKAEKEVLKKIEFLTSSEVLPMAEKVQIDFKATNQYGEAAELNAGNFTIQSGQNNLNGNVSGKTSFYVNNLGVAKDTKYPVTIIHSDSGLSASKVFTVGEYPTVSKIELGEVVYPSGATRFESGGKEAYLKFTAFDQYGTPVTKDVVNHTVGAVTQSYGLNTNRGITRVVSDSAVTLDANPFVDFDGDGTYELKLTSAASVSQDKDVTITLFANGTGQSVSKTVKVEVPKNPATVEFGAFTGTLAVGDVNKYIPITVKDNAGNALSADDVVTAARAGKFTIYATSSIVTLKSPIAIEETGADRGKIKITNVTDKGNFSIFVSVNGSTVAPVSNSFSVQEARTPASIRNTVAGESKLITYAGAGATVTKPKFKVYDQFGAEYNTATAGYSVTAVLERVSGDIDAITNVVVGTGDTAFTLNHATTVTDGVYKTEVTGLTVPQIFDDEAVFTAGVGKKGTFKLTYKLIKNATATTAASEVYSISKQVEVIDGKDTSLVYTVAVDGAKDNTLFAAGAKGVTVGSTTYSTANSSSVATLAGLKVGKGLKLTAKDAAGNAVAVPANSVFETTTTDRNVVGIDNATDKIVGLAKGTATVTVAYTTPLGTKTASVEVTVKEDAILVDTIAASKTAQTKSVSDIQGKNAWDAALMEKVTVTDQYGNSYVNEKTNVPAVIQDYNQHLGIRYYVTDVKFRGNTSADTVTVDAASGVVTYNQVGATGDISSFTLTAVAPNGKSVSTVISMN